MKDALRNFLRKHDEVVATYCKIASIYGQPPINDKYSVVFYQKDGSSFSINEDFTEEELTKAKRYWKFVEKWYEVKSMKDILRAKVIGGNYFLMGADDAVENTWEVWRKHGLINCKGPED